MKTNYFENEKYIIPFNKVKYIKKGEDKEGVFYIIVSFILDDLKEKKDYIRLKADDAKIFVDNYIIFLGKTNESS